MLYKTEKDKEAIARVLGRDREAKEWGERAASRAAAMRKLFWDAERGESF